MADDPLPGDLEHLQEACEDVGQRQEEQEPRVASHGDLRYPLVRVGAQVGEVAMGQDGALGRAGGPRGVDDRRERGGRQGVGAFGRRRAGNGAAGVGDGVERVGVQGQHPSALPPRRGGGRADELGHGDRLGDDEIDVGVGEDVRDLLGRARLVDGDRDQGGGPAGEVEQCPLVAGARHDGDSLAGSQPHADESGGDRLDLLGEVAGGDRAPHLARLLLAGDERAVRRAGGPLPQQCGQGRPLVDAHEDGGAPLQRAASGGGGGGNDRFRHARHLTACPPPLQVRRGIGGEESENPPSRTPIAF